MSEPDGDDWKLFTKPAPLVNMAARAFARLGERRVRNLGFNIGQVPVLYLLRDGAALSQKELARRAKIEPPTMTQLLTRMERDGHIRRTPDPADARSSLVSLTAEALEKLPAVKAALDENRDRILEGFSPAEIMTLVELLQKLNANLDRELAAEYDHAR